MWLNLDQFADWYLQNNHPFKPPAHERIYHTNYGLHSIIFRESRFQVELCLLRENSPLQNLNLDQLKVGHCLLFLNGGFVGYKNGAIVFDTSIVDQQSQDVSIFFNRLFKQSQFNIDKLVTADKGATFMSIQYWPDELHMTSLSRFTGNTAE